MGFQVEGLGFGIYGFRLSWFRGFGIYGFRVGGFGVSGVEGLVIRVWNLEAPGLKRKGLGVSSLRWV